MTADIEKQTTAARCRVRRAHLLALILAAVVLPNLDLPVRSAEPAPARLAVGTFSVPAEAENLTQLASVLPTLLTAELSKSGDFELVERTQLDAALKELHFNAGTGFLATNVMQLGQLLSADWLVSGSLVVSDAATNVWTKLIHMRQGTVVAVGAVPCNTGEASPMAKAVATFVIGATLHREGRQFIGVGTFQELSLPSRELGLDWGRRLQTQVEEHFQLKGIGMVEREHLTPLLDEWRLRDGGFAAKSRGELKVQPAFWLVDGGFKWYRDITDKLSVALRVERVGYREHISRFTVATPDEMGPHIIKLIEEALADPIPHPLAATPLEEAAIHLARGKDLMDTPYARSGTHVRTATTLAERDKILRTAAEYKAAAAREFETALLLNPQDMESRYRLGLALLMQKKPAYHQRAIDVLTEAAASDSKEWAARSNELLQEVKNLGATNSATTVSRLHPIPTPKKPVGLPVTLKSETIAEFEGDITVSSDPTSFWIGNGDEVLQCNKRTLSVIKTKPPIPLHSSITCLAVRDDSIWLATDEDGVLQMTKSGTQYHLWTNRDGLLCPGIKVMFPDGDRLWLGFAYKNNGGVGYIDLKNQKFVATMSSVWLFKTPEEHAASALEAPVRSILRNGSDSLWVGTWGGLQSFHPATSNWFTALKKPIKYASAISNRVAVSSEANAVLVLDVTSNVWSNVDLSACFTERQTAIVAWDGDGLWIGGGPEPKMGIYDPKTRQFVHSVGLTGTWPRWLEFDGTHAWTVTHRPGGFGGSLFERVEKPTARLADNGPAAASQPR